MNTTTFTVTDNRMSLAQRSDMLVPPRPDSELDAPRRVKGDTTLFDVESLAYVWGKYSTPSSELFADPDAKLFQMTGGMFGTTDRLGAMVRCGNGQVIACEIAVSPDDTRRIDILQPFDDPGANLGAGSLVATGVLGKQIRRVILTDMVPGADFT